MLFFKCVRNQDYHSWENQIIKDGEELQKIIDRDLQGKIISDMDIKSNDLRISLMKTKRETEKCTYCNNTPKQMQK